MKCARVRKVGFTASQSDRPLDVLHHIHALEDIAGNSEATSIINLLLNKSLRSA